MARRQQPSATGAGETAPVGLVIRHHGHSALVEDTQGRIFDCNIRKRVGRVVCGDRVRWKPTAAGQGVILAIEPRKTLLTRPDPKGRPRPLAANLDQVVVVCAPQPPYTESLIDRYLVATELMGADALILMNKSDLLDEDGRREAEERLAEFEAIGYPVVFVHTLDPVAVTPLLERLPGHTSILVGQSGVGKSSLVNALLPEDTARTGTLSEASGLGRHTTTDTTLYHLPTGGDLIDSPGVRDFKLWHIPPEKLAAGFREFAPWIGQCRFHNCRHLNEPGCAVARAAAEGAIPPRRLDSYREIYRQISEASE